MARIPSLHERLEELEFLRGVLVADYRKVGKGTSDNLSSVSLIAMEEDEIKFQFESTLTMREGSLILSAELSVTSDDLVQFVAEHAASRLVDHSKGKTEIFSIAKHLGLKSYERSAWINFIEGAKKTLAEASSPVPA